MDVNGVGWIAAIIIGGLAGWFAEMVMKSNAGVLMNIILGIAGAVVLNAILRALNIGVFGVGWTAYLITGFIGACLLIWAGRLVRR
ncbi:GlsB/YeaQ/YmgE family stress response membrane protein [Mesorhizobium sp. B2-3-6]|uniref:GlsB/YeaQ/YmgE family stress response membrane protein n=1 Tax=Mesorhizobium sp. B2-3-6 TaxID=2589957 RepID=UPI00112AA3FA|nr:GlsB/YeaQ/YmgE family stress response membrane protein [Mesorhizobium sp. B2-3-6]TPM15820.1 GlsB/YeaQ/YmgE family stress response membrane protein [Mesorhizobium sp. B2-3-6]